jgi:predicted regulator of Ras-like GTPase activity (Roadblock/LC7/MglB family)
MLSDTLHGLRDVDEVQGSFLVGGEGELLARDLPAVFHAELFAEVGPRLVRLRETFDPSGSEATTLTLRFADHKLHVRSLRKSLLCVLTGAKVNGPALRMAMNLVARRVEAAGELKGEAEEVTTTVSVGAAPRTTLAPASGTLPPASGSVPAASRRDVLYRGRRPG